jgi:hypothetical protein
VIHVGKHIAMNNSNGSRSSIWQRLMQRPSKWMLLFTRKRANGNSEQLNTSSLPASPSGKLYRNIHECPLSVFIICLCDGDLSALIIEGKVSDQVLLDTWEIIYQDYSDAISSDTEQAAQGIVRKINLLEFRITKTLAIQTYLDLKHDDEYVELLRHIGAADTKYPDVPHLQQMWWKRINGRVKRWQVEVEAEKRKLALLNQSMPGAQGRATRETFQDFIVQIEKYVRFNINEKETSVGRFVAMVKDYQRYVIALSKQVKK